MQVVRYDIDLKGKVLEIGGGNRPIFRPNVDVRKLDNVDIVHDLNRTPWPFRDEEFDGIYGGYILEHLSWRSIRRAVKELYRILRDGGKAIFLVPNTVEQCRKVVMAGEWRDEFSCLLFGDQDYGENSHACGFCPSFAKKLFAEAGFRVRTIAPMPDVYYKGIMLFPRCDTDFIIEAHKGSTVNFSSNTKVKVLTRGKNCTEKPEKYNFDREYFDNTRKVKIIGGKTPKKIDKLNIGSFTVMISGDDWLNIDIIDLTNFAKQRGYNFLRHDIRQGLPFDNNSISFINASHLIEHLTVEEGRKFLKECYRVLKRGGILRIGTPDLRKIVDAYIKNELDKFNNIQPKEYRQASNADKVWRLIASPARQDIPAPPDHKTIYDFEALKEALELAGFKNIRRVEYDEKYDMFPEISLYVEAIK